MKIVLLGKDGQVGWELQRSLSPLGEVVAFGRAGADLENAETLRQCAQHHKPDIIVNAAAYTAVDKAESESEKAYKINAEAAGILAEEAERLKAWIVHYSTDYVFGGEKSSPYDEQDQARPLSVYGQSKYEGEKLIQAKCARHLIFRTGWVYAARGSNFAKTMLRLACEKETLRVVADQHGAPTSAELIADSTALILHQLGVRKNNTVLSGVYHMVASGATTWHAYAQFVLELAEAEGIKLKVNPQDVQPIATDAYPLPAKRPMNSCLNNAKLARTFDLHMPEWHYHLRLLMPQLARGAA